MRRDGIFNWTLPAWVTELPDGRRINVCPSAGACVKVCYARNGTYNFPKVKAAHQRNLMRVLDDLPGWEVDMMAELDGRRFRQTGFRRLPDLPRDHLSLEMALLLDTGAAAVRIHDAGDFFSDEYTEAWLRIAWAKPKIIFYAYCKEVSRFRRLVEGKAPANFLWTYSIGGKEDHLIDLEHDQHAEVFPDEATLQAAGYVSQDAHDLLCVLAPSTRVGIPANNIPAFRKRMDGRTFGEMEAALPRHGRE